MIDWFLTQRLARHVAGEPDAAPPPVDLQALATDSAERVIAYTGLAPRTELPPAEGIGRGEWIAANVRSMRMLIDPVMETATSRTSAAGAGMRLSASVVVTAELGFLLGLLAKRVLGQYEVVLLDAMPDPRPPRLLFVLPNLAGVRHMLDADEREFLTWVALHEVTHAVQFAGVPWLQPHMAGMVRELLEHAELRIDTRRARRLPRVGDVKRLAAAFRSGGLVSIAASPEERATLDRMQVTMAVIEGHAEHVMDAVGAPLLPSLPRLRAAMDARRRSKSASTRLLHQLLGFEMKMRQYEQGKRFCDAVVERAGVEALHRVWDAPEMLPSGAELEAPDLWLERTYVPPPHPRVRGRLRKLLSGRRGE